MKIVTVGELLDAYEQAVKRCGGVADDANEVVAEATEKGEINSIEEAKAAIKEFAGPTRPERPQLLEHLLGQLSKIRNPGSERP